MPMNCDWCGQRVLVNHTTHISPDLMKHLLLCGFTRDGLIEQNLDTDSVKQIQISQFSLAFQDQTNSALCSGCTKSVTDFLEARPFKLYLIASNSEGERILSNVLDDNWPYLLNAQQIIDDIDDQAYQDVLGLFLFSSEDLAEEVCESAMNSSKLPSGSRVIAFNEDELIGKLAAASKVPLPQELFVILDPTPGVEDMRHVLHSKWFTRVRPIETEVSQLVQKGRRPKESASYRTPAADYPNSTNKAVTEKIGDEPEAKTTCKSCGKSILLATSNKNDGMCMPCAGKKSPKGGGTDRGDLAGGNVILGVFSAGFLSILAFLYWLIFM